MAGVPTNQVELEFADGTFLFALKLPQLDELQEKAGAGIGAIFGRLLRGRYELKDGTPFGNPEEAIWHVRDITETIRLGLIGGGKGLVDEKEVEVSPPLAKQLVDRYVVSRPLKEGWAVALAVLTAAVQGYSPDEGAEAQKKSPATKPKKAGSTTPKP